MALSTITVNAEYERLAPPVSDREYQSLKQSIKENGLYMPIVVNADGVVLDGHHRFRACSELDIEPRTEVKTFADPLLEKKFVIEANLKRRHLTEIQRAELGIALEPIEAELNRRKIGGDKKSEEYKKSLPSNAGNDADRHERETVSIVAKQVGLSPTTYQRAKTLTTSLTTQ